MHDPAILRTIQYHPIALFFVAIGRPDEAVALVERALVVDPGNLESRVMLGNFQLQAGRLDDALRVYEGIAAEEPQDSRPLFGAADVYKRRGDFARAAEARRKAHELDGDEDAARAFARATTEAEYAKAEVTVARAQLRDLEAAGHAEVCLRRSTSPACTHRSATESRHWPGWNGRTTTTTSSDCRCSRWTRPGIPCAQTRGLRPSCAGSAFPDPSGTWDRTP